jgi:predicted lipid-binding transport protein (Tim44 family)
MNNGLQFLDILIFAMVAGFLLLRLRRALGRRTGNEQPPQFLGGNKETQDTVVKMPAPGGGSDKLGAEERPGSGSGLSQVRTADPLFDESAFLEGARAAFEIVLGAFAKGEITYQNFAHEIERREDAGERLETTLVSIILTDIIDAKMVGDVARVTVKFVSEQVNVTHNEADDVVAGDASQVSTIEDIWTFGRDTGSNNPNWRLVETRAGD